MNSAPTQIVVVLGPTASGKTALGVRLADALGGEILSADSRQVYRGLDIGSGKDLHEYDNGGRPIPYHLIDVVELDAEFSVFDYQRRFFATLPGIVARGRLPVVVGGTGLYLDAVLEGYRMVEVPEDPALRAELAPLSAEALRARLEALKPRLHNTTDLTDRARLVRAIEIAVHAARSEPEPLPPLAPLVLGAAWDRAALRARIAARLRQRLDQGLIEEVHALHERGVSWERLDQLGLEYRYVARYLEGSITNRNDLFQKLNSAIAQFSKRQQTWFRRMERRGAVIHWIREARFDLAMEAVRAAQERHAR